jgi:hypothetical protein
MVCVLCIMRAVVRREKYPEWINESPRQHFERVHPDPVQAALERRELEAQLTPELVAANAELNKRQRFDTCPKCGERYFRFDSATFSGRPCFRCSGGGHRRVRPRTRPVWKP